MMNCFKQSTLYRAECLLCSKNNEMAPGEGDEGIGGNNCGIEYSKEKVKFTVEYIGESSKSAYDRGVQHMNLFRTLDPNSFILRHQLETHPEVLMTEMSFKFSILRHYTSAFRRQLGESVRIKISRDDPKASCLNNKLEYNRCVIPEIMDIKASDEDYQSERDLIERLGKIRGKYRDVERILKQRTKVAFKKKPMPMISLEDLEGLNPQHLSIADLKLIIMGSLGYKKDIGVGGLAQGDRAPPQHWGVA